ncbi:chitinase [Legionella waltersii]|uniref:Chitinase domain protein n=1 Tax=Legionella waltersii TaxID=66969 RepID=A0A0W0ZZX6_9GAMM|nr:chitinase [Legionella waltersii]KTD74661.1 chitinase domain protein [Legionella waltersii]SNV09094.1 chitinase domain protein [Legionella waltersii]
MRWSQVLSLINGLLLSSNVASAVIHQPVFSPYVDITLNTHWDSQTQDMEPMDLLGPAKQLGLKSYHAAFITDSGQCQPAWGGQQAYSVAKHWGKREFDKLAANHVNMQVSFGGASGTDLSYSCDSKQLLAVFKDVIKHYHAETLDFDIENGTANIPRIMDALQLLVQENPDIHLSFTLPVMPEGLTSVGEDIVRAAKQKGLNFHVNIMAMDYGPVYAGDMGEYAISAATQLHRFLQQLYPEQKSESIWEMVEVTPMIGVNDVNVEQFTLFNADQLRLFAQSKHLGGLAMWSLTRDKPCADLWASPVCSGNNLQSHDFEFVEHLL